MKSFIVNNIGKLTIGVAVITLVVILLYCKRAQ